MGNVTEEKYPRTKKSFIECIILGLSCSSFFPTLGLIHDWLHSTLSQNEISLYVSGMLICGIIMGILFFFGRNKIK